MRIPRTKIEHGALVTESLKWQNNRGIKMRSLKSYKVTFMAKINSFNSFYLHCVYVCILCVHTQMSMHLYPIQSVTESVWR